MRVVEAVVAIIARDRRFLFVKRSDHVAAGRGYWCPVSGRIEPGETQPAALQREVLEEVGLHVVADKKVAEGMSRDGAFLLHYWSCRIIAGTAHVASDEATALRWLTVEELQRLAPVFEENVRVCEQIAHERGWRA